MKLELGDCTFVIKHENDNKDMEPDLVHLPCQFTNLLVLIWDLVKASGKAFRGHDLGGWDHRFF